MKRILGVLLPYIGPRTIPMNRDGTPADSGELDMLDEVAPCYVRLWVFEWLGRGWPIWPWAQLRDWNTGEPVNPTWETDDE